MKRHSQHEKGSSLVEFSLILPLLILIISGVADFGRAYHDYIIISNASREGARFASHFPDNESGIQSTTANEALNSGITIQSSLVSVTGLNSVGGNPITVTVEYPFRTIMGQIVGVSTITLTARSQMLIFGYD
jgi:Flp pilus assembly protein TadG